MKIDIDYRNGDRIIKLNIDYDKKEGIKIDVDRESPEKESNSSELYEI